MRISGLFAAAVFAAQGALAQDVLDGDAAHKQTFDAKRVEAFFPPQDAVSPEQAALLEKVVESMPYYGAVAVSPDDGLLSEVTTAVARYHSVEDAARVALSLCEEKRKGARPCLIVMHSRPRGWAPRPLQLSSEATAALRGEFRRAGAPRAFAISPATGRFGIGKGPRAAEDAVAACGAADCRIRVAD